MALPLSPLPNWGGEGGGTGSEAISFRSFLPDCKNNDCPDDHQQVNGKDNDSKDPDVTKMFLQVHDCLRHQFT